METLRSSSSWVFSDNCRAFSSPPRDVVGFPEIRSLSSPRHAGVGISHSFSLQHKSVHPILVSSLSPSSETQQHLQSDETQIQEPSETVRVKFQLQKRCEFGEQFLIVGDDPMLGSWDPLSAIPMEWSSGHLWTLEMDLPIGKSIQFKFILKGTAGKVLWQPGADRILQTWETENTISVSEDWDNTELQMIIEEEPTPQMLTIAANLIQPRGALRGDVDGESGPAESASMVAENISDPVEKPQMHMNEKGLGTSIGSAKEGLAVDAKEELLNVSNKNVAVDENTLGNNGSALTHNSLVSKEEEAKLVSFEGDPVLVPGLTPLTSVDFGETSPSEANKNDVVSGPIGVDEAKQHKVPELDLKKKCNNDSSNPKNTTVMVLDQEEEHRNEQAEELNLAREQDHPNSLKSFENDVLKNDVQWGQRTLQKLLSSFGFPLAPN